MKNQLCVRFAAPSENPNLEIQSAIDEVAACGGGTVEVARGEYSLRDAIRLRNGVRLRGETGTTLIKTPSVSSSLADYVGYGMYEISVAEPEKFAAGMGVHIGDDGSFGYYTTIATITGRDGRFLFIDQPLKHDYRPLQNGRVASLFSLIDATAISDAAVENLILDGNPDETEVLSGCRGAGVFLLGSHRVRLQNIEVRHYKGDAISFQQCTDIIVRDCHLHHNSGGGLHPGSGTMRYLMENNRIHDNGRDGIFYCLRTMNSICAGNTLERNGKNGISLGDRDSDHLICENTIRHNGGYGIEFRESEHCGADRVRIQGNQIGGNGRQFEAGKRAEISIRDNVRDIHIQNNSLLSEGGAAIAIAGDCARLAVAGNQINGREQQADDVAGRRDAVQLAPPEKTLAVDPEALDPKGARHLNIEHLRPWSEVLEAMTA